MKLLNDYFSGNSREVFGQFPENLNVNRKPWENYSGLIFVKNNSSEIVGKMSVNFRNIFGFIL